MDASASVVRGTVVLTGATSGIGRATAEQIAADAGHLILHGVEDRDDVSPFLREIASGMRPQTRLDYFKADFGDLAQVSVLASQIRDVSGRVDLLINNAGRPGPAERTVSAMGNEVTFQTNYLAPVLLTTYLLDRMGGDSYGRIINVASATHYSAHLDLGDLTFARGRYSPSEAYARSKLALVAYSAWLAEHSGRPNLEVVSLHPGVISTGLLHAMFAVGGDRPQVAAGNILHVASRRGDNGAYYDERRVAPPSPVASDPAAQERLHAVTSRILSELLDS